MESRYGRYVSIGYVILISAVALCFHLKIPDT